MCFETDENKATELLKKMRDMDAYKRQLRMKGSNVDKGITFKARLDSTDLIDIDFENYQRDQTIEFDDDNINKNNKDIGNFISYKPLPRGKRRGVFLGKDIIDTLESMVSDDD